MLHGFTTVRSEDKIMVKKRTQKIISRYTTI